MTLSSRYHEWRQTQAIKAKEKRNEQLLSKGRIQYEDIHSTLNEIYALIKQDIATNEALGRQRLLLVLTPLLDLFDVADDETPVTKTTLTTMSTTQLLELTTTLIDDLRKKT